MNIEQSEIELALSNAEFLRGFFHGLSISNPQQVPEQCFVAVRNLTAIVSKGLQK